MRLAIIPARGGSKRIPRKNLRMFCGSPIICYPIKAAIRSNCFDEVMVSTDDPEIADIAISTGASVPFRRSARTSGDDATTSEVLLEVLETYGETRVKPDLACCIYPTASFVTPNIIREGMELLLAGGATTVMPVTTYPYPIQRALRLKDGFVSMIQPEYLATRTQDLERTYHDTGQFYWFRVNRFLESRQLITRETLGMIISNARVQDIDNEDDWILAELKFQRLSAARDPV
jgi:pseudaminic acid cytidylyltransferase